MFRFRAAMFVIFIWAGSAQAQTDLVFSGPQPWEKLTPFKVHAFGGPSAGKPIELLADPKETPRVLVFVHEITRPAFQLIKPVDQYASQLAKDGLETHFIWLTADKAKTEQFLQNAQQSLKLTAPIVISLDGIEGPGNYGLNRKVTITVLIAKGNKVVANFAIVQPNETDAPKVTAAIAKLMGKTPPANPLAPDPVVVLQKQVIDLQLKVQSITKRNADLEKLLEQMTDALNQAREQIAKLEGKAAPAPLPKLPKMEKEILGKASQNADLQQLMRRMVQVNNDDATVRQVAGEMLKWAGNDRERVTELKEYCKLVLQLGYGTPACQKALAQIAGK